MRRPYRVPLLRLTTVALFLFLLAQVGTSWAIPAFSRQHHTECSTCHTIFPQLNEFGDAFLKNSYVWPATKRPVGPATAATHGQEWLKLAPIPENVPVSFSATLTMDYTKDDLDNKDFNYSTRALRFLAGGSYQDQAGFYATYRLYTEKNYDPHTANVPTNNQPDLDELFISWRNVFNSRFAIRIGRMEPKLALWKKSGNLTIISPAPLSYTVGDSPFTLESPEDALELNSVLLPRLYVAAGVVDRDGQNTKEGYGHIGVKIGGTDYLGREPEIDLDKESIWDYLTISLAGFGYSGRNSLLDAAPTFIKNDYYRVGGDMDILYKRLRIRTLGVAGRDNNPLYGAGKAPMDSLALSSQAEVLVSTSGMVLFRYEYLDIDGNNRINRFIPAIAYAPLQNIRVSLEHIIEHQTPDTNRLTLAGVTFTF